jgi:RNA recognition motif-containing protein
MPTLFRVVFLKQTTKPIYYFFMKLFVANLDRSLSHQDVEDMFQIYGSVLSAKLIVDKETGQSKGYGFVEMESELEASDAIENLHETEVKGRVITVKVAVPPDEYKKKQNNNFKGKSRDFQPNS